jgi:ferric-dicitrate binding protein FerR (iron transport regulator)
MRNAGWVGLGVFAVAAASAGADDWSRQFAVKGRPELRLATDDGSIRVEVGTGSAIEASVTTEGWKIAPDEVTVNESQTGDQVTIEVRLPQRHDSYEHGHRSVKLVVRVPAAADLDIRTGDGSVSVAPITGRVTVSTGDGSITVAGLRGEVRLHTGDGSIKATGLEGRLRADTGDGSMEVRGRFDALDLRTGDGSIAAEVERGSKIAEAWSLSSGDGGITVRLPEDLGAELDAHAGSGDVTVDAPVTVTGTVSESTVRGTLAGGGGRLRVHTGDGSIHLKRL